MSSQPFRTSAMQPHTHRRAACSVSSSTWDACCVSNKHQICVLFKLNINTKYITFYSHQSASSSTSDTARSASWARTTPSSTRPPHVSVGGRSGSDSGHVLAAALSVISKRRTSEWSTSLAPSAVSVWARFTSGCRPSFRTICIRKPDQWWWPTFDWCWQRCAQFSSLWSLWRGSYRTSCSRVRILGNGKEGNWLLGLYVI